MTKDEQMIRAAAVLILHGKSIFTRNDVRITIGVDRAAWDNEYSPRFQGMRIDQPGGAPNVGSRWKGIFQRVARGRFQLTLYGLNLVCQLIGP